MKLNSVSKVNMNFKNSSFLRDITLDREATIGFFLYIFFNISNLIKKLLDPLLLSPLMKGGLRGDKRGGIRFSALPVKLYENRNQLLEALQKRDLKKILKGFLLFFQADLFKNK